MAKHNKSTRINIPMCAACVLLCLTLLSIHLTSGLYAKYTATATGSDSARVAKFEVVTTGDTANVIVTSGETTDNLFEFNIDNQSEVAISYSLEATPIPGVTATFDKTSGTLTVGGSAQHSLEFDVTNWVEFITGSGADSEVTSGDTLTKNYNFTITVHVEQID